MSEQTQDMNILADFLSGKMPSVEGIVALLLLVAGCCFSALADGSTDASALLGFQRGISEAQVFASWNASSVGDLGCPVNWLGVTCSFGRVLRVDLASLSLHGQILPGTLGSLSQLLYLNLSGNFLSGNVPDDLGSCTSLESMDLSDNAFAGGIPGSFGGLKNLKNLSLAGNGFEGGIPEQLSELLMLQNLDISSNALTGGIPDTLVDAAALVSLNLASNRLSGNVSMSFQGFAGLQTLDLHGNQLSGPIDGSLLALPLLERVDLSDNVLTGQFPWPQNVPKLPSSLQYFNLSNNHFEGVLAQPAANIFSTALKVFDVSSNFFNGSLPNLKFDSVTTLRFGNNRFVGRLPAQLYNQFPFLEDLDLSGNQFTGTVEKVTSLTLKTLDLSSNLLQGQLPLKFESCRAVDLSKNNFSGDVSVIKDWGADMETIDVSWNDLTGPLPDDAPALLSGLRSLTMSHNGLSGEIPSGFNFSRLEDLDLSSNVLSGSMPSFLFNLSLVTLVLSDNIFSGSIDIPDFGAASMALPALPLQVLNLSTNRLSGPIPSAIAYLLDLYSLDLSNNTLSGPIPANLSKLENLQTLDLSFNQLTGPIPEDLGLIPGLKELNLSYNDLSGTLPESLRRFPLSAFSNNPLLKLPKGDQIVAGKGGSQGSKDGSALQAGLIGGSTAVAAIAIAAALFLYYRRVSKSQVVLARSPEYYRHSKVVSNHVRTGSSQEYDSSGQFSSEATSSGKTDSERILKPKGILKGHSHRMPAADLLTEESKTIDGDDKPDVPAPPIPYVHLQSQGQDSTQPPQQQTVIREGSPERLAGDLFLLDSGIVFTAEELSRAPAEVLGRSSHGTSYKATLDNGHVLTVKWLREGLAKSRKKFISEAKKFGNVKHPNVMSLRGYYWGPREHEKLLVSDFVSSGGLASRLYERTGRRYAPLTWQQRSRIAVDIARGLCYLHLEHQLPHGNLKASNVLLSGPNLDGKLADYSLHRLVTEAGTANTILNAGALGYRSSELASAKKPKPSFEADVYAFGVILMEILTGKGAGDIISGNSGAVDLPDWVRLLANEGRAVDCFDPALVGVHRDQEPPLGMEEMLLISLSCIATRSARPSIRVVYEKLAAISSENGNSNC